MGKVAALVFIVLLALTSVGGFLLLSKKIAAGERRIAAGGERIDRGQTRLEAGKVKLAGGRQKLSAGKKKYETAHHDPALLISDTLLQGGAGFKKARRQIAVGEWRIDKGQGKIEAEERRLDTGEQKLSLGKDELKLGKAIRLAFGFGALFLAALSIFLGLRWGRALSRGRASTNG